MRPLQNQKKMRRPNNNNRRNTNPLSKSYESSGPEVKIRGTAAHVAEKYVSLARDAQSSGDSVMAENYLQHAEHYFRIIANYQQANQSPYNQMNRESDTDNSDQDSDLDDLPLPFPQSEMSPRDGVEKGSGEPNESRNDKPRQERRMPRHLRIQRGDNDSSRHKSEEINCSEAPRMGTDSPPLDSEPKRKPRGRPPVRSRSVSFGASTEELAIDSSGLELPGFVSKAIPRGDDDSH